MNEQAERDKIREIFTILTQGVELVQYEVDLNSMKSSMQGRIVWMDSDTYRICVDSTRPAVVDRAKGKIPPGIYLRDICEVRQGVDSFHFRENRTPPKNTENCLSLIGSERTISLEFPSSFSRDWFFDRLILLTEDVLTDEERQENKYKVASWDDRMETSSSATHAFQMEGLLARRGVEVLCHQRDGLINKAILSYSKDTHELILVVSSKTYFNFAKDEVYKIHLTDISEIRPGSHSYGFVKTNSTSLYNKTLSIISTQHVFDLEFISKQTRDLFAERLHDFCIVFSRKDEHDP